MKHLATFLLYAGSLCLGFSLIILVAIFYQPLLYEFRYAFNRPDSHAGVNINKQDAKAIHPIDPNFDIIIPKIGANTPIISSVDPYNSLAYQVALSHGVAQARGTAFPYEKGDMFLFAHSAANALEATRFNAIFYLLTKLQTKDTVYIYYKNKKYSYEVTESAIVDPEKISYLNKGSSGKTLTLMTCWPAGTSFKRLLIFAKQVDQ